MHRVHHHGTTHECLSYGTAGVEGAGKPLFVLSLPWIVSAEVVMFQHLITTIIFIYTAADSGIQEYALCKPCRV